MKQGRWGVMGIRDVQGGVRYDRGVVRVPPYGIFNKMFVPPPWLVGERVGSKWGVGGRGSWVYLRWSAGVSSRIWSQMCISWYFPQFLFKKGINTDVHGLFDVPWCSLWLYVYNCEIVWADWVPHEIAVLMDREWGPKMVFQPVPKCSQRLSNIFLGTVYVWAFEFVDNPTLLKFVVPLLRCHEESFCGVCPFEVYLYSLPVACPFEFLP